MLYALGKLLYELITGLRARDYPKLPPGWADAADHERRNELNQVVLRACEVDVNRRYKSADQMRSDLELLKDRKSLLRLRKLERAYRRIVLAIGLLLLVIALGGAYVGFRFFKDRANEEERRHELGQIRISRMAPRKEGWSSRSWSRLAKLAANRPGEDLHVEAMATFAGLDVKPSPAFENVAASSVAFADEGRLLFSGVDHTEQASVIGTDGVRTRFPTAGEGPVCWSLSGVPLVLGMSAAGDVQLTEAESGKVRRRFSLASIEPATSGTNLVLAMSSEGRSVAAAGRTRVCVWDTASGAAMGEITVPATALAFSQDGLLLAVGCADGTTRVYSVPSLKIVAILTPPVRGGGDTLSCIRPRLARAL